MNIMEIVGVEVENTAEWRREKAEEFPNDNRNLEAAERLDRLVRELDELQKSDLSRRIESLVIMTSGGWEISFGEWLSEELRAIGFRSFYKNGAEFLQSVCEWFEEEIRRDEGFRLDQQIENDEAVKAAKRAYEEARAKAYAKARKRLD